MTFPKREKNVVSNFYPRAFSLRFFLFVFVENFQAKYYKSFHKKNSRNHLRIKKSNATSEQILPQCLINKMASKSNLQRTHQLIRCIACLKPYKNKYSFRKNKTRSQENCLIEVELYFLKIVANGKTTFHRLLLRFDWVHFLKQFLKYPNIKFWAQNIIF